MNSIHSNIISNAANDLNLPYERVEYSAIMPISFGTEGRNFDLPLGVYGIVSGGRMLYIPLPAPARNLMELLSVLDYDFRLTPLGIRQMVEPVVHIDVPSTLERYGLEGDITNNLDRIFEHLHVSRTRALQH